MTETILKSLLSHKLSILPSLEIILFVVYRYILIYFFYLFVCIYINSLFIYVYICYPFFSMYILRTSAKKVISGEEKITGWDFLNLTKLSGHIQGNAQVGVSIFRYTTVTTYFCLDKSFHCN